MKDYKVTLYGKSPIHHAEKHIKAGNYDDALRIAGTIVYLINYSYKDVVMNSVVEYNE